MAICDKEIAKVVEAYIENMEDVVDDLPTEKKHKRLNKNSLKTADLNIIAYQYFGGVDLLEIPGVSHSTVLSLMSEIGPEGLSKFSTAKHFTSWLRLAPNNKDSDGRIISSKVPIGSNRLKIALRNAVYSISRLNQGAVNGSAITGVPTKLIIFFYPFFENACSFLSFVYLL